MESGSLRVGLRVLLLHGAGGGEGGLDGYGAALSCARAAAGGGSAPLAYLPRPPATLPVDVGAK